MKYILNPTPYMRRGQHGCRGRRTGAEDDEPEQVTVVAEDDLVLLRDDVAVSS